MLSVGGRKAKASSGLLTITTLFSDQTGRPLGAWAVSSPCNLTSGHSICVAFVCFDGVLSASSTVHRTAYREETSHRVRAEREPPLPPTKQKGVKDGQGHRAKGGQSQRRPWAWSQFPFPSALVHWGAHGTHPSLPHRQGPV